MLLLRVPGGYCVGRDGSTRIERKHFRECEDVFGSATLQASHLSYLDVPALDLQGISLQRPVVVHQGPKQRDSPDLPVRRPLLRDVVSSTTSNGEGGEGGGKKQNYSAS